MRPLHGAIQARLEALYGVQAPWPVELFVVTHAEMQRRGDTPPPADETVLLRAQGDTLELAVVFRGRLLEATRHEPPPAAPIDARRLPALCSVTEGVSHFLYAAWSAAHDRPISPLELEVQAEVDKFALLLDAVPPSAWEQAAPLLLRLLFENFRLHPALDAKARALYLEANRLAARVCHRLATTHARRADRAGTRQWLRSFYRLGPAKLALADVM